jgi:hypothetical protein
MPQELEQGPNNTARFLPLINILAIMISGKTNLHDKEYFTPDSYKKGSRLNPVLLVSFAD